MATEALESSDEEAKLIKVEEALRSSEKGEQG